MSDPRLGGAQGSGARRLLLTTSWEGALEGAPFAIGAACVLTQARRGGAAGLGYAPSFPLCRKAGTADSSLFPHSPPAPPTPALTPAGLSQNGGVRASGKNGVRPSGPRLPSRQAPEPECLKLSDG